MRNNRRITIIGLLALLLVNSGTLLAQQKGSGGEDAATPDWRYEFQKKYELFRDYGYDWRLGALFGVNPEDGLILGAGPILYQFGFRTFPYISRMELLGGMSLSTARYKVLYNALWPALGQNTSLELKAYVSQLEVRNFYGYGNDSQRDEQKDDEGFYRVSPQEYFVRGSLLYHLNESSTIGWALQLRDFSVDENTGRFLSGVSSTLASLGAMVVVDRRDHPMAPHGGFVLHLEGWNMVHLGDDRGAFQKAIGDLRVYFGDTVFTDIMFGIRIHGELLKNRRVPFFEAGFLGGPGSLRGYASQRFAGDAVVFGSAELRFSVGRWYIIVPTEVGAFLLCDAGRVWVDGESRGSLHTDVGAGVWLAPLSREFIFSLGLASSVDGVFVFGGVGFGF